MIIDDAHPEAQGIPALAVNERSHAAAVELAPIDPADEGQSDYTGPLVSDLDFGAFSHSALVRIADEVCLQMQLLDLAFAMAVRERASSEDQLLEIRRKQLTGVAGVAALRLARALGVSPDEEGARRVLALHPLLNPAAYVAMDVDLVVQRSAAHDDGAWISLLGPEWTLPLQAIVQAVDPYLDVEVTGTEDEWRIDVVRRDEPAPELQEVSVVKFSTGTDFGFEERRSLPITPV